MWLPTDLPAHAQIAFVYGTKRERWSAFSELLFDSVEAGVPVVMVTDGRTASDLEAVLNQLGVAGRPTPLFLPAENLVDRTDFAPVTLIQALEQAAVSASGAKSAAVHAVVDMALFVSAFHRTERLVELHALLRAFALARSGLLLQAYFYDFLPDDFSFDYLSEGALLLLSDSIRRSVFPELAADGDRDHGSSVEVAMEQLALRSIHGLRTMLVPRTGSPAAGGASGRPDTLQPRFFHQSLEGVLLLDSSFLVYYASPQVRRLFGDEGTDYRGTSIADLLPEEAVHLLTSEVSVLMLRSGPARPARPYVSHLDLALADETGERRLYHWAVRSIGTESVTWGFLCSLRAEEFQGPIAGGLHRSFASKPTYGADGPRSAHASPGRAARPSSLRSESRADQRAISFAPGNGVTRREYQIIGLLMNGMQNKEIAEELGLAHVTVKKHLSNIYHKLNIKNRFELLRITRWS